jgi:hypothetical protein
LTGATERATADAQLTPSGFIDKFRDYAALPKGHEAFRGVGLQVDDIPENTENPARLFESPE